MPRSSTINGLNFRPELGLIVFQALRNFTFFLPFGCLALLVFLLTLNPSVPGGDSGELISVSYALGVAHPPGYPLYTMLAHLATHLPFGSVAWRVNFLSALFSVICGYVIFLILVEWLKDRWLGLFAAGLFIFSPLNWRYSVAAEVFTLNNLFAALLILWSVKFLKEPRLKWASLWALTLGLACSHHHTILFLALPLFGFIFYKHHQVLLRAKVFWPCLGLFLVGFLPYLYLPWAAKKRLIISWGEADTWSGFWTHFLRKEYGTFKLATGESDYSNYLRNLKYYAVDLWFQFLYAGVVLIAYSLIEFVRRRGSKDQIGMGLLVAFVFYTLVFHWLANMDLSNSLYYDVQSRFWLLPNMILCLFYALGLSWILDYWPKWKTKMTIGLTALVVGLQLGLHFRMEDYSKNRVFHDLGKSLLDGLPQGAILFIRGDVYINSIRYLQTVERHRVDVMSVPFDLMWWPWMKKVMAHNFANVIVPGKVYRYQRGEPGAYTLVDFFSVNDGRFVAYTGKLFSFEIKNLEERYELLPLGFLNRLRPKGEEFNFSKYRQETEAFKFVPPTRDEMRDKSWEAFVFYNYWDREMEKSRIVFSESRSKGDDLEMVEYGAKILEVLLENYPDPPSGVFRNLGVAYQILKAKDPKYVDKMVDAWEKYLSYNPKNDAHLSEIYHLVRQYKSKVKVESQEGAESTP